MLEYMPPQAVGQGEGVSGKVRGWASNRAPWYERLRAGMRVHCARKSNHVIGATGQMAVGREVLQDACIGCAVLRTGTCAVFGTARQAGARNPRREQVAHHER